MTAIRFSAGSAFDLALDAASFPKRAFRLPGMRGHPSRLASGKFKGRLFYEAGEDGHLRSWADSGEI